MSHNLVYPGGNLLPGSVYGPNVEILQFIRLDQGHSKVKCFQLFFFNSLLLNFYPFVLLKLCVNVDHCNFAVA